MSSSSSVVESKEHTRNKKEKRGASIIKPTCSDYSLLHLANASFVPKDLSKSNLFSPTFIPTSKPSTQSGV
ncbi:hypothetical protein QVD17_06580 [Tagetes erecta]|uniref:Uncharacterized protein n=1 Tax=Tagetes erecta TaxID=13708 RepID=A0AAD8PBX6_TARER|nr:hypothetical protein QVD17_06580 [Tagetes erecta]